MSEQTTETLLKHLQAEKRKDRRASYFKYSVIGGLGLLYIATAMYSLHGRGGGAPELPYVAMVRIEGEIGSGKSASAEALNPLLEAAFSDPRAKGVALLINSPGGTPVQSALIHDRIKLLKKQHNKKVVAVAEDLMASGAYMIAVSADNIVVNRSTITGSIGVVSRGFGFTGLIDKLGVERRVMTAGEAKNQLDPFVPQSTTDKAKQGELLAEIHEHFKDVVKEGRGDRLSLDAPGLFSGTVWTGSKAIEMGLADKLGDVKSASKEYFDTDKVFEFKEPKSLMQNLMGDFGVKVAQELIYQIQAPASQVPQLKAP